MESLKALDTFERRHMCDQREVLPSLGVRAVRLILDTDKHMYKAAQQGLELTKLTAKYLKKKQRYEEILEKLESQREVNWTDLQEMRRNLVLLDTLQRVEEKRREGRGNAVHFVHLNTLLLQPCRVRPNVTLRLPGMAPQFLPIPEALQACEKAALETLENMLEIESDIGCVVEHLVTLRFNLKFIDDWLCIGDPRKVVKRERIL